MRTTIAIDDHLLEVAKRRARRTGLTLGQLVEEALHRELARDAEPAPGTPVPAFRGEGGVRPGVDVASNRALQEALDEDLPLDRRR